MGAFLPSFATLWKNNAHAKKYFPRFVAELSGLRVFRCDYVEKTERSAENGCIKFFF
jgi:hypothetical protein